MLENINTKQTLEFYSKDAKLNSQIYEQIQLRSFHTFLHLKKKKRLRCPIWEVKKRINRIERREKGKTSRWGSRFTRNIYSQNSKQVNISLYTHLCTYVYKYSMKLEGGFWISPQVLRRKGLACLSCRYLDEFPSLTAPKRPHLY